MIHKATVYEARTTQEVSQIWERLEKAHLQTYKRKIPPEMLFLTVLGPERKPIYQITASYKSDQRAVVEFLIDQTKE